MAGVSSEQPLLATTDAILCSQKQLGQGRCTCAIISVNFAVLALTAGYAVATSPHSGIVPKPSVTGVHAVSDAEVIDLAACVDSEPSCVAWASRGECTNNPDYMLPTCKKSCLQCGTGEHEHGITYELIYQFIQEPQTMFHEVGFTNLPVLLLTAKALYNYLVQIALYLRPTLCHGKNKIWKALKFEPDGIRFSLLSIAFQVANQASAVNAYVRLLLPSRPWTSGPAMTLFAFFVSQHVSTISVLVGMGYNVMVALMITPSKKKCYDEKLAAIGLIVSGILVASPVLVSVIWVAASKAGFFYLLCGMLPAGAAIFALIRHDAFGTNLMQVINMTMFLFTLGLAMTWLILGITTKHAWLAFLACIFEFAVPAFFIGVFFLRLGGRGLKGVHAGFMIAFSASYIVTVWIPASILDGSPEIGLTEGGPEAFWGKKILPYVEDTFAVRTAFPQWREAHAVGFNENQIICLWWSQFIGFFS